MNIDLAAVEAVAIAAGKVGAPFIEQALTAIASGYLGPLAPAILTPIFGMINKALGISEDADPTETAAAIEANPDAAKAALDTLSEDHSFQLALEKQGQDYQLASQDQQVQLNTVEAQNPSIFVAGWRPLLGWTLGAVLTASAILPYVVWLFLSFGYNLTYPPPMDQNAFYVLSSILGITIAARTVSQIAGVNTKAIGGKTITTTKVVK